MSDTTHCSHLLVIQIALTYDYRYSLQVCMYVCVHVSGYARLHVVHGI